MKAGDVVELIWDDHAFHFGENNGKGVVRTTSVGYLVRDTESEVAIAISRNVDGFSDIQVVDKRMLLSRKKVR